MFLKISAVLSVAVCVMGSEESSESWAFIHEPNSYPTYYVAPFDKFDQEKPVTLRCKFASVTNATAYTWKFWRWGADPYQNNWVQVDYSDARINQSSANGSTITISNVTDDLEGFYRCLVQTENKGIAVDQPILLRVARMEAMSQTRQTVTVRAGTPYSRQCTAPNSVPPARAFWIIKGTENPTVLESIQSSHIHEIENKKSSSNNLHFQYVAEEDRLEGFQYRCSAENEVLKDIKFGPGFNFEFEAGRRQKSIMPYPLQISPSEMVLLRGSTATLSCLYGFYPALKPSEMHWRWYSALETPENLDNIYDIEMVNSTSTTNDRYVFGEDFTLEIVNVRYEDAGQFTCHFRNYPEIDQMFEVRVESAPFWLQGPPVSGQTVQVGQTAVFDCKAGGERNTYKFSRNNERIRRSPIPDRWIIDNGKLTILNAQIEDSGDFQCSVINDHSDLYQPGRQPLWANFHLRVLDEQTEDIGSGEDEEF